MAKFHVRFFGSSVIEPVNFLIEDYGANDLDNFVQRQLKNYFPVYHSGAAWKDSAGAPGELIAEWTAYVAVIQSARYINGRRV